jgi:hypothetical protein
MVASGKPCRLLLYRVQQHMGLLAARQGRHRCAAYLRQKPLDAFNVCGLCTGRRHCLLHAGRQQHGDAYGTAEGGCYFHCFSAPGVLIHPNSILVFHHQLVGTVRTGMAWALSLLSVNENISIRK